MANLLEYAFALDPRKSDPDARPMASLADDRLAPTFVRRRDAADLGYAVWASGDLQTWVSGPPRRRRWLRFRSTRFASR